MVIGESIGTTDVAIIGAGFGGYVAAIRLAELGKKVTLIDRESVGGVCLHHGCIPTKALIHAADTYHEFEKAAKLGITFDNLRIDFPKTQEWKRKIVDELDAGIRALLRHHNIQLIKANAFFEESNKLALRPVDDSHLEINALEFGKCIIASGSTERELPGVRIDGTRIITSKEAVEMEQLPSSMLIIGGGYIGVEISQMLAKLGVKVTIIEALPSILELIDGEFSSVVKKRLEEMKAEVYCNAKVEKAEINEEGVKTTISTPEGNREITTEKVLVAVGRVPNAKELRLENTKVKVDERGFVTVDRRMQTTDTRIFAIGDAAGGVMLAHKATFEAKIAAEAIAGMKSEFDALIPYVVFSNPEIAGVGLTEKQAKKSGVAYKTKSFRFSALGKAHIMDEKEGFFKILYDENNNILGVHIAGPRASDMIGEAVLAMEMGATLEDMALIIHPHPTLVEGFSELADLALGTPTNTF